MAHAAESLAEDVLGATEAILAGEGRRLRLDAEAAAAIRSDYLGAGYAWATWCYLPGTVLAAELVGQSNAIGSARAQLERTSMALSTVTAWWPGRIAARFDPEVLAELVGSPLSGDLPVELLERLPTWGLYLDCPHWGAGRGVLASLDPETITAPDGEVLGTASGRELWLVFRLPDMQPSWALSSVWIGEGSLPEALAVQARSGGEAPDHVEARSAVEAAYGAPYAEIVSGILSMLLYLCSTDPDLARIRLPLPHRRAKGQSVEVEVLEAGFRIGAALRAARAARSGGAEHEQGRGVAPHIRSAHFHSYWTGPRSDPERRQLELRWLPPIPVNLDAGPVRPVVRDVRPVREL